MPESSETWFFTSYAWSVEPDKDPEGSAVSLFHDEIAAALRPKVATRFARNGFLDKRTIDAGAQWDGELTQALRSCRTFLPLLTPSYFTREACGKEWAAFRGRLTAANDTRDLIIPVLWDREAGVTPHLPEPWDKTWLVPSEAHFNGAQERMYLNDYKRLGLSAIARRALAKESVAQAAVTHLANVFASMMVERVGPGPLQPAGEGVVPAWSAITAAFGTPETLPVEPGPTVSSVYIAVAAGTSAQMKDARYYRDVEREWIPFRSADVTAERLVQEALAEHKCTVEWLDAKTNLSDAIRQLEENGCYPAIVLVDACSLEIEDFRRALRGYDRERFKNSTSILVWNYERLDSAERAALERSVYAVFVQRNEDVREVSSIDALRSELVRSIPYIREKSAPRRPAIRPIGSGSPLPLVRT